VPATIRPVIVTADLDRLFAFYTGLLDAQENFRYPDARPVFYVGLALGDSEIGRSAEAGVQPGSPGRMLPWGQRVAHIADPDGNVVNLTQSL
jgi:predicted enzyme related to lactoylglutathione lyase